VEENRHAEEEEEDEDRDKFEYAIYLQNIKKALQARFIASTRGIEEKLKHVKEVKRLQILYQKPSEEAQSLATNNKLFLKKIIAVKHKTEPEVSKILRHVESSGVKTLQQSERELSHSIVSQYSRNHTHQVCKRKKM